MYPRVHAISTDRTRAKTDRNGSCCLSLQVHKDETVRDGSFRTKAARPEAVRYGAAILIAFGLLAGLAHEARPEEVVKPALIYGLSASVDLASTRYLMAHNGREAWLPSQSLSGQAGIEAGAAALLTLGDIELQKHGHKGWAKVVRIAVPVIRAAVAGLNLSRAK